MTDKSKKQTRARAEEKLLMDSVRKETHQPSDAEWELIDLVRGLEEKNFRVTISVENRHWVVGVQVPRISKDPGEGEGASFEKAWADIKPYWHDAPISLRKR